MEQKSNLANTVLYCLYVGTYIYLPEKRMMFFLSRLDYDWNVNRSPPPPPPVSLWSSEELFVAAVK